jgi:gliding motility-associated-like protein
VKRILLTVQLLLATVGFAAAQDLTINTSGQTGTSGTNWSTSGTNPVTISFTGTSNINTSVIEGYLNSGTSLIIQSSGAGSNGIQISTGITKSSGTDATLTLKANKAVYAGGASISSTVGKLNVIFWVEADGGTSFGPSTGPISTNGGHIWIGGGSGNTTWNGLTVGNGTTYSDGSGNINSIDVNGNMTTSGGDIYIAADGTHNGANGYADIAAWNGANRTLDAGAGDISLMTQLADFTSSQGSLILNTSGTLSIGPPNSGLNWTKDFTFAGTLSGTTLTGTNDISGLIINNYSSLGGLSIGTYSGAGLLGDTNYTPVNNQNVTINTNITTTGSINVYGLTPNINANLTTTNPTTGDIYIKGTADVIHSAGKTVTTSGGDVVYWADSDANGGRIEVLGNISTSGGHFWAGGGSTTESSNGLTIPTGYASSISIDKQGVLIRGASINSGGGSIRIKGESNDSGNGTTDVGTMVVNSTIQSGAGNLSIYGTVKNDLSQGGGLWVGSFINGASASGNVNISSTSGDIYLEGISAATVSSTWAHGLMIIGDYGDDVSISSTTGKISFYGDGTVSSTSGSEALGFVAQINNIGSFINVNSDGGAINFKGISTNVLDDLGVGFRPRNVLNSIKIGDANTGTITVQASSLQTEATTLAGTISFEGTGAYVFEPTGTSFGSAVTIPDEYSFASSGTGFSLGKNGNTANLTLASAISLAGPISVYGGNIFAEQNLTATASGAAILLQATGYIDLSASRTIESNNGNITFRANAGGTAVVLPNTTTGAITLNSGSSLLSKGGNITLGGNFDGTKGTGLYAASARTGGSPGILINNATLTAAGGNINIYGRCSTSYDDGIRLQANISTTGAGSIGLYGDAFGGNNGTEYFGGITFFNGVSRIEAVNGNVTLEGILTNSQSDEGYGINFYRSGGATGQTKHIQILSRTGNVQITGDRGTSIGRGIGHSSHGNIYFGSPVDNSYTASGDVKFTYSNLINAGFNGFKVKTTGDVTYEPVANSFDLAQIFPANANYVLAESASSLTIGKATNTANITMDAATTVAGPITVYGGTIAANANLTSTATSGTGISLNGQRIIQAAGISAITQGANIDYSALNAPFTNSATAEFAMSLEGISSSKAIINANGGNIKLDASFASVGTAGGSDRAFRLVESDIITSASGTIVLNGDATNNTTTGTAWGFQFNNTRVQSNLGAITITGTGGKATTNSRGIGVDNTNLRILSNSGSITINDLKPAGLSGTYNGLYFLPATTANVFIGADGTNITSSSSSVNINSDKLTLMPNSSSRINVNTSGPVVFESNANTFDSEPSITGLSISGSPSSVRFGKTTNTANITFGNAVTAAGPITAYGGSIEVNSNLTSTLADAPILMKATAGISTAASVNITTNKGDLILWSDSDNTSGGAISIGDNNVINTSNGLTTIGLSGGGNIVLAGGLDDGSNGGTASDGVPDGFASNSSNVGVNLGTTTANYTQMYSGGGDILLKANSTASGTVAAIGLYQFGRWLANSGQGAIDINGKAASYYGINFTHPASNVLTGDMHLQLISAKTSGNAITINGTSTNNYGVVFNYNNPKEILATGGGDIIVNGTGGGTSQGIFLQNQDILASAGNITLNGGVNGFSFISGGTRIGSKTGSTIASSTANVKLIANTISPDVTSINTTGTFTFEPFGNSFTNALTYPIPNLTLGNTISGLTLGKPTNTQNITIGGAISIAGPITAYGGAIAVNESLNTTTGTASGDILLKSTSDISLAASKSITTAGGDVILWSNSDNAASNGSISLRNGSSITTGSGTVAGGQVWLGGGSDGATWNGLAVGSGYAVPGTIFTPSNGGGTVSGGIYLEGSAINSFGGHVKLAGDASTSFYGILSYATNSIDSKAGKIELDGNASHVASTNSTGVLFGIHDLSVAATMNLSSSASDVAINISGLGRGTGDAVALSGTLNVLSTGTGEISINGNAIGTGRSIVAGNYYSGILNAFANSGKISLNGGTKAVQVADKVIAGKTLGSSKINLGQGSTITNSSSDVFITADNIALADGGIAVISTGKVTIESFGNSFASALTFPIANLSLANTVSGLTLGKTTNTQNITFGGATTIAGPITAYGGTVAINSNLTSTATTGTGVSLDGQRIIQNVGIAVTTSGANIDYLASGFSTTSGVDNAIKIGDVSGARASINAGGGNVSLTGSFGTTSTAGQDDFGIYLFSTDVITSGTGSITLTGDATNTLTTTTAYGMSMGNATLKTASGAITLNGTGGKASNNSRGIVADQYSNKIVSASGAITLNEIKPTGLTGTYTGFFMKPVSTANSFIGADGTEVSSSSSSVTIKGDKAFFDVNSTFRNNINTSGAIVFESVANSFETAPSLTGLTISGNPSSVRVGKTTNTANITLGSAVTAAGPIEVYGGTIAVNAALTATNSNINLTASTAATQTAAITANGLALNGAGTFTLTNPANNIATIAGGSAAAKIGSLSFVDASGGLEIGTVNPTGITATGPVKIETLEGNITLSQNIATDNTTSDAIILNAGKNTAIGTATGGDIIVSGTPTLTMGTGGIAKLFSGSEGGSTGLNTLIGASNVRESVDETSAAFNPALSINNKYALYRFGDAGSTIPTHNIWYVDNNSNTGDIYTTSSVSGNDATGTGSASAPFATLSKAVTSASAGDIIYVDSGTYSQNSITINKKLTIIGAGSGNTIFDNGDGAQLWANITSSNVIIKNLTLTKFFNANASFGQVININGAYTGINFENILINNCLGATSTLPNVNISGGASVTIRNSFFKCSGYNGAMGGGILVNNSTAVIENTIFFQNESASSSENGGAIQIKGASANVTVTNCTFNGCVSLKGGAIGQNGGTLTITGSCFSNNISETDDNSSGGGAIFVTGTSNTSISNCLFDTNAVTAQAKGTTSISVGNATSADGGAICFKNVNGTASVTNSRFVNNGKLLQTDGQILINGFDDGQDIFYSGSSLNITINNNTFSSANSGEVNIYEETGNQTMSNNGIYTQTGSTGPTVNALSTTRTGVSDGTQTGWSDTSLTGTTTINMLGSLLTPIRTDVYSTCSTVVFTGWIDNSVTQGGTCNNAINQTGYLNLSSALSSTISPAMNFTTSSAGKYLTFRARTNGGTSTAANAITVSVSTDNGTNWTTIGTRTPTTTTLTQMTPFDLSTYTGTQVKVRFQSLSATGTIGVGIDDIVITSASTLITPSLDFSNKGVQVLYTSALVGGTSSTYNLINTSISEDNGTTWTQINTSTTAGTYTLDLYNYHGTTTKLKFETPYANGTSGASLDNIIFNYATSSNTNPNTYCHSPTSIAGCNSTLSCSLETLAPIILNCVENKSITDCSLIVPDYRSEVAAYDDCSFTISQSPAPGTLLSSLGNGNHTITFIVSDLSTYSQDTSCSMVLTVSGCAVCTPPSTPSATVTVQPTSATTTGTIVFSTQSGVEYSIDGTNYQASPTFTGVAANTYTLKVRSTSDNSCTATGSTVTVNAAPSAPSAHLASLTVGAGTLSPVFDTNVTDYAVLLPAGTNSFSFTPTLTEGTASMTINEVAHTSGTVLTSALASKSKTFIIQVTSGDNSVVKEYTLTVVVPSATDALAVVGQSATEDAGYVRFILTGKAAQKVSLELADITAKGLAVDYGAFKTTTVLGTANLEASIDLGKTWTVFNNFVSIPATKLLWVRTPLNDDALIESEEKFKLIVSPVDDALTGMEVYDINYNLVNLNFPATTLSGTAKTVGAVYRQLNAVTIDGQVLDARMEIKGISNVTTSSYLVDNNSSNTSRFQSELNASAPAGSYIEYELKFFKSGTNTQVGVKNFFVTSVDVDGREYIELNNFSSYQVGSGSSLTISNPRTGFTRYTGSSTSLAGIDFEETASFILNYTNPIASLVFRKGNSVASSNARLFSMAFGNSVGTFSSSISTESAVSVSAEGIIIDNDFPAPTQLTITVPQLTKIKDYSGTNTAVVVPGTITGIKTGDVVTLTATATYETDAAGTGKKITVVYTLSGADAADYLAPVNFVVNDGVINPLKITVTPTSGLTKVYGSADPTLTYSQTGALSTETAAFSGSITRESGNNVGKYKILVGTLALANNGAFKTSNYTLNFVENVEMAITKAALTVTVKDDSKFVSTADVTGFAGITYAGFVYGETKTVITETGLLISRSNSTVQAPGVYNDVLIASGLSSNNYSFNFIAGDFTIVAADQLLVKIKDQEVVYGQPVVYEIASAKYLSSAAAVIVDLTANASNNNGKVTITDGAGGKALFDLNVISASLSSSSRLEVGSYLLGATNIVETSVNFNNTIVVQGNLTITPLELIASVKNGLTKVYDANREMKDLELELASPYSGDLVNANGVGTFGSQNAGAQSYSIGQISLSGDDALNYFVSGGASAALQGTNGQITKRSIQITPDSNQGKTFAASDPTLTYDYSGTIEGETPGFSGTLSRINGENPGNYEIEIGNVTLTNNGTFLANNYDITFIEEKTFNINQKSISSNDVTVSAVADLIYNGDAQTPKPVVKDGADILVEGVDYTLSYSENTDAGTATITITGIGDYSGTRTITFKIKPAELLVTPDSGLTKVYGSLDPVFTYTYSGNAKGETPSFGGTLTRETGQDVATYEILKGSLVLLDSETFKSSNYKLIVVEGVEMSISKAVLTVIVKDDSKFITKLDVPNYAGINYDGFVFGQDASVIDETLLTIARSNSSTEGAGEYQGVLEASGLSSDNYSFDYQDGDYVIVAADQLLVKIQDQDVIYGQPIIYQIASAKYLSTSLNNIVDLTANATVSNGKVTITDGVGGTALFDLAVTSPLFSTSSRLEVGAYKIDATNIIETSVNFSNTIVVQGNLNITPKELVASVTGGLTKEYDGHLQMNDLTLALATPFAGDKVDVSAKGVYDSESRGSRHYTVSDMVLAGIDSENYYVQGGASATLNGSNAEITKRKLVITPDSNQGKIFGESDSELTYTYSGNVIGTIPAFTGVLVRDAGEAQGEYEINLGSIALIDNDSFISSNYDLVFTEDEVYTINKKNISSNGFTVDDVAPVIYNGQNHLPEPAVKDGDITLVKGLDYNYFYSENKDAGTATITIGGINDYSGSRTITFLINPAELTVIPDAGLTKVYGDSDPELTYTYSGQVAGETPAFGGVLTRSKGEDAGLSEIYQGSLSLVDNVPFKANNYTIKLIPEVVMSITRANLAVQVNNDSKFVTKADLNGYAGLSFDGFKFGEDETALDFTNLKITRINEGIEAALTYEDVLSASGLASGNYAFNYLNGDYTIIPAEELRVKIAKIETVYGETATYSVESASYVAPDNSIVDLTASTSITNGQLNIIDGASGTASFDITLLSPVLSTAGKLAVGSYNLGASNISKTSTNFSNTIVVQGLHTVIPKELTVSVSSSKTKVYDANAQLPELTFALATPYSLDKVGVSGTGIYNSPNAGVQTYTVSGMVLSGDDAANYFLTGGADALVQGTDGEITKRELLITPKSNQTKVFGEIDPVLNYDYSGNVSGEIPTFTGTLSRELGQSAGLYEILIGSLVPLNNENFLKSNYDVVFAEDIYFEILSKNIQSKDLTLSDIADRTYDGSPQRPKPIIMDGEKVLIEGIDYELIYTDNVDAGTSTITIKGKGDYTGERSITFVIKPRELLLTPDSGLTKVYGSADPTLTYTYSGNIAGETPGFTGTLSRASGENAALYEINLGSLNIVDNGAFKIGNYIVKIVSDVDMTITRAPLIVKVNNDSKFVTKLDVNNYAGIRYEGFKFGEKRSVIDETNLRITRTNAGIELANVYAGVLSASGVASGNYSFTYERGDFTIVGADQLLVKIADVESNYGDVPTYGIISAEYLSTAANFVVVNLLSSTTISGRNVTVQDGASGNAIFDISEFEPVFSTANKLAVRSYVLSPTNIVETSPNFKNTVVLQGIHVVNPIGLTATVTSLKSKVYDGNAQMPDLQMSLAAPLAQDKVTVNGRGVFSSKNAGPQSYTVDGLTLSGDDADNYYVLGGASALIQGNDGLVSRRKLKITPDNGQGKIFGQADPILIFDYDGNLISEKPKFNGLLSRESGEPKADYKIELGTLSLSNNGSFLASNYEFDFTPNVLFNIDDKSIASSDVIAGSIPDRTYNGLPHLPKPVLKDGFKTLVEGVDYTLTYTFNTVSGTAVITVSGIGDYSGTRTINFQIVKAALIVLADDKGKTVGAADPSFTVKYTGFVNGETKNVLSGTLQFNRAAGEVVGDYDITPSGLSAANYQITFSIGTLSIGDSENPNVIIKNITVELDANGQITIVPSQIDNGSNDLGGIASMLVEPSVFTCANIGPNTVTLTVTDSNGNKSTASAIVTVVDRILPTVKTKNITVELDAKGQASITAAQIDNGSFDNCAIKSMLISPASFNCANVGGNTVTLTITDVNGNVASTTAIVTVINNSIDSDKDSIKDNCDEDDDNDGLTDVKEVANGTESLNPDSDGDGVSDGQEILDGTNPKDACIYSLASQVLAKASAEWLNADCDKDGLTNGEETTGIDNPSTPANPKGIKTDPRNADSDGDGVSDAQEALDGTNPNDSCSFKVSSQTLTPSAAWANADCDGDGVTNGKERADGTSSLNNCDFKVSSRTLAPNDAWKNGDCDGDGLKNEVDGVVDCDNDGIPNFQDFDSCKIDIVMANVFTPNGDGINDEIKPVLLGIEKFICFKVFNRWGNLIFETKERDKGWDGSYKESNQGTETFQWLSEGYDRDGNFVKRSGMVTLLR